MLKNVPAIADFRTKIRILLLQGKGSPTRFKIMKHLRIIGAPLTNRQLSSFCGVSCSSIRLHLDTLIASEIITRNRTEGMNKYGMLYLFSPFTLAHIKELDEVLASCKEFSSTVLVWHDYGACCKSCERGYDTPRYSEPCVSCKVARSNYVPKKTNENKIIDSLGLAEDIAKWRQMQKDGKCTCKCHDNPGENSSCGLCLNLEG